MWRSTLAQMRRVSADLPPEVFHILTATTSRDANGKEVKTYAVDLVVTARLINVASGRGADKELTALYDVAEGGNEIVKTSKLILPYGTPIDDTKFVRQEATGVIWDVASVLAAETVGAQITVIVSRKVYKKETRR